MRARFTALRFKDVWHRAALCVMAEKGKVLCCVGTWEDPQFLAATEKVGSGALLGAVALLLFFFLSGGGHLHQEARRRSGAPQRVVCALPHCRAQRARSEAGRRLLEWRRSRGAPEQRVKAE